MSRSPLVLALVLAVASGGRVTLTQPTLQVPADVLLRAQAGEQVDVIVGVESTFAPEGRLRTSAEVGAQRTIVAREVDDVRARVAATGAVVGDRFDVIPFFRAQVNARSLVELARTRGVTSVEENLPNRPAATDTVPFVNAPPAWAAGATGAGWNVAVLDTGVDGTHPFLSGKIISEACYSGGGPGATSLCPGGAPSSTAAGSGAPCTLDGCFHGTAVAGVAVGVNGPAGLTGTAPGGGLVAIKIASRSDATIECGGFGPCPIYWDADIVSGINRVATLAGPGNAGRIAALNLSIASFIRYSTQAACDAARPALKAAIDNLRSLGVAVVAGAGNDAATGELGSPACISSAIAVGATTSAVPVEVPQFSNDASFLQLLAPGILDAALPGGTFSAVTGTSFATPHVAGAWAVLKQAVPLATPTAVLAALTATGTPLAHWSSGLVHPVINVDAARLQLLGTSGASPGAVTGLTVGATGNALTMAWAAPTTGGAPVNYDIQARLVHGGPVVATVPVGNVTSFAAGAPSGTYVVSVRASNAAGAGAESNPVSVTFPGLPVLPHRPTSFSATLAGTTVTFAWTAPTTGGPVANYLLLAGPTATGQASVRVPLPATSTTVSFPGVPPGTWYVGVYAQNATGYSGGSNVASFTVAGPAPPGPPVMNPATVANRTVTLSWVAGAGGSPTSFVLTAALSPGGAPIASVPLATTSASFPNVPTGTYYVRVAAVNGLGTSGPSNEVVVVVP